MAVAHDAATGSVYTAATSPHTFNHTPTGTPKGVLLFCINYDSSTKRVTAASYGGQAMTEVGDASDTAGEATNVAVWFLGSGIPTGQQQVSIDVGTAGDDHYFVCVTVTASTASTAIQNTQEINGDTANPQVTLQYGGISCLGYVGLAGGASTVASYSLLSGMSTGLSNDSGQEIQRVDRQTSAGTSNFTIGYSYATSDDVALFAVAVREETAQTITGQSVGLTANISAASVLPGAVTVNGATINANLAVTAGTLQATITRAGASIGRDLSVVDGISGKPAEVIVGPVTVAGAAVERAMTVTAAAAVPGHVSIYAQDAVALASTVAAGTVQPGAVTINGVDSFFSTMSVTAADISVPEQASSVVFFRRVRVA
jgi:hypothetical protein